MTQFDQQVLATVFLSKNTPLQEAAAMEIITRFGLGAFLLVATGLTAFTVADRTGVIGVYGFETAAVKGFSQPSAEYLKAVAAAEKADADDAAAGAVKIAGTSPEASAR